MSRGKGTSGFSPVSTIGMFAFLISFSTNPVQVKKEGCMKTSMGNPDFLCLQNQKKSIKFTISVNVVAKNLNFTKFVCLSVQRSEESVER